MPSKEKLVSELQASRYTTRGLRVRRSGLPVPGLLYRHVLHCRISRNGRRTCALPEAIERRAVQY